MEIPEWEVELEGWRGTLFSCLTLVFSSCCGESEVAWVRSRDASDGDDSGVGHSSSRFLKAAKQ